MIIIFAGERYEFWTKYDATERATYIIPHHDYLSFEVEVSRNTVLGRAMSILIIQ
jgi:hypothetical protein